MTNQSHLIAISIGPVQDFIAAARKTRDLWYGSELLSELSRGVAETLSAEADLIFPTGAATQAGSQVAVANKILAITKDGTDPASLFERAETTAKDHLRQLGIDTRNTLLGKHLRENGPVVWSFVDAGLFETQIGEFLEIYGAWVPYDESRYDASRRRVDQLLDGRKTLRDFAQPRHPYAARSFTPKSALIPGAESVLRLPDRQRETSRHMQARAAMRLKPGEELDGVSLVKRIISAQRFVSVSRVALDPLIRRLACEDAARLATMKEIAKSLWDADNPAVEWFDATEARLSHYDIFPYDTQLFYDNGEHDREMQERPREEREQARRFTESVRAACRGLGVGEPPAYYAILVADGDKMGAIIGAMETAEAHRLLSEALAGFAADAERIVRDHHGAMVYSGGDDVLTFLPLPTALACADELQDAFRNRIEPVVQDHATLHPAKDPQKPAVSLSAGIAIVHYSEPLYEALEWARDAEKAAKGPRNALAIALHTRTASADACTVVHRWDMTKGTTPVTAIWERWIGWHRTEAIPDTAAKDLRDLAAQLRPVAAGMANTLCPLLVQAILRDKRAGLGTKDIVEEVRTFIAERLTAEQTTERQVRALEQIVDEMLITRRLARARDDAEGRPVLTATAASSNGGNP